MIPFGSQGMVPEDLNKQMTQMMRELNQMSRGMMPNVPNAIPDSPFPGQEFPPIQIQPRHRSQQEELPPYMDPNSI